MIRHTFNTFLISSTSSKRLSLRRATYFFVVMSSFPGWMAMKPRNSILQSFQGRRDHASRSQNFQINTVSEHTGIYDSVSPSEARQREFDLCRPTTITQTETAL